MPLVRLLVPVSSLDRYKTTMKIQLESFPGLVRDVRRQLEISQEELAQALGVSFATVNRWENGKTTPSKLARRQVELFCERMMKQGKLNMERDNK